MIKNYLLLLYLCLISSAEAQIINFPDANFKAKLVTANSSNRIAEGLNGLPIKIDTNEDGEIDHLEALQVKRLNVKESNIKSLEGINYFTNITTLYCRTNSLTYLNLDSLVNLTFLDSANNQLTTLDLNKLKNLTHLDCQANQLTSLNLSKLTELRSLAINNNKITYFDPSPLKNLISFYCEFNQLATIDVNPLDNLFDFNCSNNLLTTLNINNLSKLRDLNCSINKISNLNITELPNLTNLNCSGNQLISFSLISFTKLKYFACKRNKTKILDLDGLVNLEILSCSENELTNLDLKTLRSLKMLSCSSNLLKSLDITKLPDLESLAFRNNQITTIDFSSNSKLQHIIGAKNPIEYLDFSNLKNLEYLTFGNTPIHTLDLSNSKKLIGLNIASCPNLKFINLKNGSIEDLNHAEDAADDEDNIDYDFINFRNCPNLKYICADDSQIEAITQKISAYNYVNCVVGGYCTFVSGEENYTIKGSAKLDLENNGCNVSDPSVSNLKFLITGPKTSNLITDQTGNYLVQVPIGEYTIKPILENPDYFAVSPSSIKVDFKNDPNSITQNFCVIPSSQYKDLEINMIAMQVARPGFDTDYKIIYKNKGNISQSGTVNLSFKDDILDFISAIPAVSNQSLNNLSWTFTDLKPFENREISFVLNVNSPIETPAVNNGDILNYTTSIHSAETDKTPIDNTFVLSQKVVGSYDPNDKTCLEGDVIKPELIGEYVHYMIRFENTGTYAAQNIVVKDMIDLSKFDISTLIPTSSSHLFVTKISDGNKVEFIFENISLPFDDAHNDGYVAFKIKTLPTLKVGDSFTNEANIYFDYNFPILTNKPTSTFKTLGTQDFIFSNYFSVHPNPAVDVLNINSKKNIEVFSMAIYDVLGQLIIAVPDAQNISAINVSSLTTGNYILKAKTDKGISAIKFVKK
ncbi:DUF7619 domain-containing protein [Flavobacterium collinsii]|uniref:Conserved leucine-rich repeat (LRR) protein containing a type A C-terminal secretion signal n=1 Tax=Flavobacterium collinsii TaxID=1114861 RepID=A0A9W4XFD3_9FLAO|nr:T9SS type A sorting domain-containing protein [Flavobacterium collinsii]CAI2768104.1 conserved leucine-rich repeat (LRR) protein precursor containing a type A C-terminal secretion signal [Flavobacterium collinsii]